MLDQKRNGIFVIGELGSGQVIEFDRVAWCQLFRTERGNCIVTLQLTPVDGCLGAHPKLFTEQIAR